MYVLGHWPAIALDACPINPPPNIRLVLGIIGCGGASGVHGGCRLRQDKQRVSEEKKSREGARHEKRRGEREGARELGRYGWVAWAIK